MPKLRRLFQRLKLPALIVYKVAEALSILIALLTTSLATAIFAWISKHNSTLLVSLSFAAGILVALLFVVIKSWRVSPARWLLRGYRWVRAEYIYKISDTDPKAHTQHVTILLEALRPGVNLFENRYFWTGRGTEEPSILSAGHTITKIIKYSPWSYYYVHLGRDLGIGGREEIRIKQNLYDDEGTFEPYLAKVVLEPVDLLILRVLLPKATPPKRVLCEETDGSTPTGCLVKEIPGAYDSATGEMRWDILSPVLRHEYKISWSY